MGMRPAGAFAGRTLEIVMVVSPEMAAGAVTKSALASRLRYQQRPGPLADRAQRVVVALAPEFGTLALAKATGFRRVGGVNLRHRLAEGGNKTTLAAL
jgi:hypothetical protein